MSVPTNFSLSAERNPRRRIPLQNWIASLAVAGIGVLIFITAHVAVSTAVYEPQNATPFSYTTVEDAMCANFGRAGAFVGSDAASAFYRCVDSYSSRVRTDSKQVLLK